MQEKLHKFSKLEDQLKGSRSLCDTKTNEIIELKKKLESFTDVDQKLKQQAQLIESLDKNLFFYRQQESSRKIASCKKTEKVKNDQKIKNFEKNKKIQIETEIEFEKKRSKKRSYRDSLSRVPSDELNNSISEMKFLYNLPAKIEG